MKAEIRQDNLPANWSVADLGDLLERITNGLTCEQEKEPPGLPVTRIETISNGIVDFERVRYVRELDESKTEKFLLKRGDILFSHINSDLHLGKTAVVTSDKPLLHGMNLLLLRTKKDQLDPYYLHYLLNFYRRSGTFMAIAQHAVNQSSLNQKKINSLKVPLAPLDQQKRIVAEIEKQFSRLDEAVANLKRVKVNLKRYKAAVLKAAVEGRLVETEAELARREGRSYETGEQLLQRILETRRSQWKGKGKYKEPAAPDTTDLPELPEGWGRASLDQIVENYDGTRVPVRSKDRENRQGPYPYYGASGVIDHVDDFLFDGEYLLIGEDGANLLSRSTPIAFQASGKFWVNNHAHIVQTLGGIPLAYLEHCLNGKDLARYITGSAQPKLTQAAMNKIPVPLPAASEQFRIVAEVDRRVSLLRETDAQVDADLKRTERLRQSILAAAFSGQMPGPARLRNHIAA